MQLSCAEDVACAVAYSQAYNSPVEHEDMRSARLSAADAGRCPLLLARAGDMLSVELRTSVAGSMEWADAAVAALSWHRIGTLQPAPDDGGDWDDTPCLTEVQCPILLVRRMLSPYLDSAVRFSLYPSRAAAAAVAMTIDVVVPPPLPPPRPSNPSPTACCCRSVCRRSWHLGAAPSRPMHGWRCAARAAASPCAAAAHWW